MRSVLVSLHGVGVFLFNFEITIKVNMRGVHRGRSTVHRVAKRINPLKMILFGVSLLVLCNVCPWSFLETRINRSWKEISSLDDAMSFAKRYTGRAQVNTFDALRKLTQKYIGLDIYFIVFNILRLTIAMALKDLICLAFPVTQPKKKSLGRKLIHTMRSQVHRQLASFHDRTS